MITNQRKIFVSDNLFMNRKLKMMMIKLSKNNSKKKVKMIKIQI